MPLPPDRGHIDTEQRHAQSTELDRQSTREIVELMVTDHRVVADAVGAAAPALAAFVDALVPRVAAGGRLVYVGAGTSGRLGVLDASECPPTFQSDPRQVVGVIAGGDASLRRSSEGREDEPRGAAPALRELGVGVLDTVLGIAAGGTTPFVLGALEIAKSMGATTGLLTCARRAGVAACDHLLVLETGPEVLTGSTRLKAGSATKLALNIVTTALFVRLGKVHGNLMVDLRATNDKLRDRALRTLCQLVPGLSREDAVAALDAAGGAVKTAAVMRKVVVSREEAERLLAACGGRLREALGERVPRPSRP
ncbi:MAG: N-acetylmuramic acid 6-phosphate etherase [Phycisphaerales bacterium]|nr:N-acetylmuramic acid 6-phosphate etherase [Phycisphaerales bacterium]